MIKQYFKQAMVQLHQQPVISGITVFGTALAIFLIMLIVMIQQVKVAPFSPESNRDRFLHVHYMSITNKNWREGDSSNGPMSVRTARECFKSLKSPEDVTIYSVRTVSIPVSLPGKPAIGADMRETDDDFWHVFDFAFIEGKPYSRADFDAGLAIAVITESVARNLFGTTDVTGKEFLLNHSFYKVCGVVRNVSTLADLAYGQIWIPFTSTDSPMNSWNDGNMGMFSVTILAHSRKDFDKIRVELNRRRDAYNKTISESGYRLIYRNRPYDQEKNAIAFSSNEEPNLKVDRIHRVVIFIILLLVPAINLSSMTQSRLRQRVAEIGVRRAFGSTRLEMVGRIVMENLVITLLAGVVGLLFSIVFAYLGNSLLFAQPFSATFNAPMIDSSILLQSSTFFYALFFCFILNLLSSGIPAWRASRTSIVNALGGRIY